MKLSGEMLFNKKNLHWLRFVALVIVLSLALGYSAYWGAQRPLSRIVALETQQSKLLVQLSLQNSRIARIETQVRPMPTSTPKPTATAHPMAAVSRSCSIRGRIKAPKGFTTVRLLQAPFLEARRIAEIPDDVQINVCGRTNDADYAKVRWEGKEGWIQTDWVNLPTGVTWVNIPVIY